MPPDVATLHAERDLDPCLPQLDFERLALLSDKDASPQPEPSARAPAAEAPGFSLAFKDPSGETVAVRFTQRPLGFKFKRAAPIVVSAIEPGSVAEGLGLRPDLELTAIDGEAVGDKCYDDLYKSLADLTAHLPQE